jgi:hypothetical protein
MARFARLKFTAFPRFECARDAKAKAVKQAELTINTRIVLKDIGCNLAV